MPDNPILPPPPPPTGKRPGDGDILVLLVGINDYANIRNLNGCIDDLNRVEGFLKERFDIGDDATSITNGNVTSYKVTEEGYNNLKICRLENEAATYEGIIDTFRSFFQSVSAADRVWFHFSGHGTETPTATEFSALENNKDQGLMCHDCINQENGVYDKILADKELAVLLHEVSEGSGGTPHIIVTIDSCHSGGLTRDEDGPTVRNQEVSDNAGPRPIETYLGFDTHYFKTTDSQQNQSVIPRSTHMVMTACSNLQLAGEENGGFFTNSLIDILENQEGIINYADLLIRTRNAVSRIAKDHPQTPQFEVVGDLSAFTRFLEGTPMGSPERYEIKFEDGTWAVGVGAIHGLSTTATTNGTVTAGHQPIGVNIYDFDRPNELAAKAIITEVGPQYSPIQIAKGLLDTVKTELLDEIETGNLALPEADEATTEADRRADQIDQITQRVLSKISTKKMTEITKDISNKLSKGRLDGIITQILRNVTEISLKKFLARGSVSKNGLFKITEASLAETVTTLLPQINRTIQSDINQSILGGIGQGALDSKKDYFGVLTAFPAVPEFVLVTGDSATDVAGFIATARFNSQFAIKNIFFLDTASTTTPHSLVVHITSEALAIEDLQRSQPLSWSRKRSRTHEVLDALSKIVNWRRFITLNNPSSSLLADIDFTVEPSGGFRGITPIELKDIDLPENQALPLATANTIKKNALGKEIQLIATQSNRFSRVGEPTDKKIVWTPKVEFRNATTGSDLFTYLFMLNSNYKILGVKEVPKESITNKIDFQQKIWGVNGLEKEDTLYFKLLVTNDPIDVHQLIQGDINSFRDVEIEDFNLSAPGFKDWCTINIKVRLINEDEMVIGG